MMARSRSRHDSLLGCAGVCGGWDRGEGAVYVALFARRPINRSEVAPLGVSGIPLPGSSQ